MEMAVLEAHEVSVRFGELLAVDRVDIEVDTGSIVGLIGPNGAGKTTLFNALSGVQRCDGSVVLEGVDVSKAPPHERAKRGMNRTFQRLEVFGSMTTYDNIRTAAEITALRRRTGLRNAGPVADEIVELIGLEEITARRADALPTGQARLVELGRALATDPKVLLLDEPASGLNEVETARLAEILQVLAQRGIAILLVEHDVDFVMDLCKTIYVLDLGALIASGTPKQIRSNADVRTAYLGAIN
jgi:branched-chain amino acid transport system ATP-binding protein